MTIRKLFFVLLLGLGLLIVGCEVEGDGDNPDTLDAGSDTVNPTSATMTFSATGVNPQRVTVSSGASVTFTNNDSDPHAIDFADGTIADFELAVGSSRSVTFSGAGEYSFVDEYKPGNAAFFGTIVVR